MQKVVHKADSRGYADHGWLQTRHSFSFADYYDPQRMNFGALRVLNDDIIAPGKGFGTHPHQNMEIITVPLKGGLEHKDSMGNSGIIKAGEVQVMSAGTGILHSEYNPSSEEEGILLQIWIFPKLESVKPRYDQKKFNYDETPGQFVLLVTPDGRDNSLSINQDAYISMGQFQSGTVLCINGKDARGKYFFMINGKAVIADETLYARDGLGIETKTSFNLQVLGDSRILQLDVPMTV